MVMLAETLLLAKGLHLPIREREVVRAMDALGEPPIILKRRQARTYICNLLLTSLKEEAEQVGDVELTAELSDIHAAGAWGLEQVGDELFLKSFIVRDRAPEDPMRDYHIDHPTGRRTTVKISKLMEEMPADLRPYLSKRLSDLAQYESHVFLKSLISTGGIYRLDGGEMGTQGVLDSIWGGLPFTDLPKLPFPRMWFEARDKDGQPCPLWCGNPPPGTWNADDAGKLWGMAISEIAQGSAWAVVAVRHPEWVYQTNNQIEMSADGSGKYVQLDAEASIMCDTHRYERIDATGFEHVPDSQDQLWIQAEGGPDQHVSEAAYRGAMLAWAVCLADIVTARNVDRRETFLSSKVRKQLTRAAPLRKFFTRVYDVSIATSTSDAKDETGRFLNCRFLVRGHWRVADVEHAEWVEAKEARCIWVRSYIKGPPGAPWRGRPVYVEKVST